VERECPTCHLPVEGNSCAACGWAEGAARPKVLLDPNRHRCADEFRGERCARSGSMSESTLGGGPWYCAEHFPAFRQWRTAKRAAPPQGFRMRTAASLAESYAERTAMRSEDLPL
jgi:hypothetical protein